MYSEAESEDDLVPLYSFNTVLGDWEVHTPVKTFRFQSLKQTNNFYVFWNGGEESIACTKSVFDAIIAVAQHKTGVEEWDHSSFEVSDYLNDWKREVSDRVIFNFINHWMDCNSEGTLREIVDYFEHEATHLIDRMNIVGFLKEMIVSGQMSRFPRVWMPPAEMSSVIELAKEYGIPVRYSRTKRGNP